MGIIDWAALSRIAAAAPRIGCAVVSLALVLSFSAPAGAWLQETFPSYNNIATGRGIALDGAGNSVSIGSQAAPDATFVVVKHAAVERIARISWSG